MKKIFLSLVIFATVLTSASCIPGKIAATPTLHGDPLAPIATETPTEAPKVVIPLTQAIPARVQFNGVTLAVQGGHIGECDMPNCPTAPAGTRYLSVTLQPLDLPSDQFLDYKNLPAEIAIHDDTGAITPFKRLAKYTPATQQLVLYFTVPQDASVFGLQWPGVAEIPLTIIASEAPTAQPILIGLQTMLNGITLPVPQDDRASVRIGDTKPFEMNDLIALHNDQRRARNPKFFHGVANVLVNCIKTDRCDLGRS